MDHEINEAHRYGAADKMKNNGDEITRQISNGDVEKQKTIQGNAHFHRLGWKRLTIVLIVEAIALGSLGLPAAFASLGMVAGVILTIGIGLIAMYAAYIIGQVKLKYPHVAHYADIGKLMFGSFGSKLFSTIFISQLILVTGSHCLTGTIALTNITQSSVCTIVFGVISAFILFLLAIPPSFTEIAILGYIDFASIILAIGITMIATGIQNTHEAPSEPWSAWPAKDLSFSKAIVAVNNIVFAYAFASAQPSFMEEMHTPRDYIKSVWALGIAEVFIYTLTGAIIYAFVGQGVQSPALLSAGPLLSRIVFGIALPVIFISGSINTTVACRYFHGRIYRDSVTRYVNTTKGWVTWIGLVVIVTLIAWLIAEAIPFFSELLSISSSLFVSGLSFYIPPVMWFMLLKDGTWHSKKNLRAAFYNAVVFIFGLVILVCGTYACVVELIEKFQNKAVGKPFTCSRS
ncbi:transmembrane amino acid transporter protein-domain-containing protein [Thelonectria olida]|uniref:Transmembrane amino acid transporter protein-domain-containing protein n=1 Tax=Thelonectria olida TaxID=1576542 RepID=A0A9P8WHE9_9HYPO|nr:transmembrane amino acid transporter protein-domain-containing protein [Thelonectria olida]